MKKVIEIEKAIEEFIKYTKNFDLSNNRIKGKQEHSLRVMRISEEIAKRLNWKKEEIEIATLIGLLHDIGRFEQYQEFKTFHDSRSVDHGDLGVKKMPKRAKKLLEIAAYGFNDEAALQEYKSIDWDSVIQESEQKDKAEKEQQVEIEKHKDEPSSTDFLFAAGFVAGAAVLGYTLYKRFFKR